MVPTMKCPRDGAELTARIYEADVEIDECPTCEGMFLDNGELEAIQRAMDAKQVEVDSVDTVSEGLDSARNEALGRVPCPRCGAEMTSRRYGFGSQVMIDVCPQGCGLWLDGGELQQLEAFYERSNREGTDDLPLTWRLYASIRELFARK